MRSIKYILYSILAITMTACTVADYPGWMDSEGNPIYGSSRHYVTGRVLDADNNPIEHIKVTIDWGGHVSEATVNYTASDGSFSAEIPTGITSESIEFGITLEDIDGPENGGRFETLTDKVIYNIGADSPTGFLVYRLNRATALVNSLQS